MMLFSKKRANVSMSMININNLNVIEKPIVHVVVAKQLTHHLLGHWPLLLHLQKNQ